VAFSSTASALFLVPFTSLIIPLSERWPLGSLKRSLYVVFASFVRLRVFFILGLTV